MKRERGKEGKEKRKQNKTPRLLKTSGGKLKKGVTSNIGIPTLVKSGKERMTSLENQKEDKKEKTSEQCTNHSPGIR